MTICKKSDRHSGRIPTSKTINCVDISEFHADQLGSSLSYEVPVPSASLPAKRPYQ